jgi:hypothetical protein
VIISTVPVLRGKYTPAAWLQVPVYLGDGDHEALGRVVPARFETS